MSGSKTKPADNHPWRNRGTKSKPKRKPRETVTAMAEQLEDEELAERLELVNGAPLWIDEP